MKVGILLDKLEELDISKDSTLALADEAYRRGGEIWLFFPDSLMLFNNMVKARAISYALFKKQLKAHILSELEFKIIDLSLLDVILIRHDPPYNIHYLTPCYFLEKLKGKVLLINDPTSLRDCPEKLFALEFDKIHPTTLITRDKKEIISFRKQHKNIIIKPLYHFRGIGVFHVKENNLNFYSILESLFTRYSTPLIIQKYIPEVRNGDKRVFLLNGEPIAAFNRVPLPDESRSNMFAGGNPIKTELSISDQEICKIVGPVLKERGLLFVGIDIIGEFLTEINATSATGIIEVKKLYDIDIAKDFWNLIEKKIKND